MPDSFLSENQIQSVLDYIATYNSTLTENSNPISEINENKNPAPTPEQISLGQNLFQGTERFSEDGAACNSCHDVKNDAVIGGGILAKDLTTVFSRMGKAGVEAVLGQAPYPVMQAAYENYPLTEQEITALIAFLQDADSKGVLKQPRDYGLGLLASGVVGGLIIFALCGLLWRGRGKGSVNQAIYDRQVKSK
jgi:cytochrome c peroxidase